MKKIPLPTSVLPLLAATALAAAPKAPRPNLLLVIADDLGTQLGCYGDATARTPHIDRLAAEGVRFDNAYVTAASCSPSRGTLVTGLYPHQHGMMGLSHFGTERMHDDVPKLTPELKRRGYTTAWIGKTHFLPLEPFAFDFYSEDMAMIAYRRDVAAMNEVAEEFLDSINADQPFFLVMSYVDPHRGDADDGAVYPATGNVRFPRVKMGLPVDPTPNEATVPMPFLGLDSPGIRHEQADFYGSVDRLDIGVGDLRKRLEARGLWDNLHVVFVGDHGPDVTRGKMAVYESATRVPLLVGGPGATPGLARDEFVSTIDLFPTLLGMAGAEEVVVDPRQTGRDLAPLLRSGTVPWRERIFTEYITHVPWYFYPRYTVREGDWKLILNTFGDEGRPNPLDRDKFCCAYFEAQKPEYDGTAIRGVYDRVKVAPKYELFNLADDPYEFTNLAEDPACLDLRDRLAAAIQEWREATCDPMLDPAAVEAQERKGLEYREGYLQRIREQQQANRPRAAGTALDEAFTEDFRAGAARAWTSPNNQPARRGDGGMTGSLGQNGVSMATPVGGGEGIGAGTVGVAADFAQSAESVPHAIHWAVGLSSENRKYFQNMDADTVCVRFVTAGPNRGRFWWSLFREGRQVGNPWSDMRAPAWPPGETVRLALSYDLATGEAIARAHHPATGALLLEDRVVHAGIGGFRHAGFEMTNFPGQGSGSAGSVTRFEFKAVP